MVRAAAGAESTNTADRAPRDRASMPSAPVPAYRSRTAASATAGPRLENSPSLARSDMGRVPAGTGASLTPFAEPAMTLTGRARGPGASSGSPVEQPRDGLAGERPAEQRQQLRVPSQVGVGLDHGER